MAVFHDYSSIRLFRVFSIFALSTLLCFLFSAHVSAADAQWQGRVVAVADGDTLTVEPARGGDRNKIRLWGVDAPESRQPFGQAAKGFVNKVALFKEVTVIPVDKDRYGRTVAVVALPDGSVLQEMLLKEGLAWVYTQYCSTCDAWKRMERQAEKEKKGLWADDRSVQPWVWRKANR
jgi:endonuclease YncB( thermonuclease family)